MNTASPSPSKLIFVAVNGTLATGVDNAINTSGDLVFGDTEGATTTATVDLTNGSAIVGGLLVQTDTTSANQIIIGTGKNLTVNGDVTIGVDIANSTDTALTVSGGGTWFVTKDSGTFQIGGATGAVNGNRAVVDMSGLDTLTVDLGIGGVFRVGDNNSNSAASGNAVTVATLANSTTITAGTLGVGDGQGITNAVATLNLGAASTILHVDSLNVGDRLGNRGQGVLQFAGGTGTLLVRGADGQNTSRTNLNVISSGAGTGLSMTASVDLTGHVSDLLLNSLVIGLRSSGNGGATSTFSFDTGMLDVNSVILGNKLGGSGTNTVSGTLNIGGGDVVIGVGGITMGLNSGGNTASTAAGEVNLTGGTVSVDGDIVHSGTTGGARLSSAKLNLDGASLDMKGHNIGDATNLIDNTFASGTLKNVAQINGGAGLTKTSTGLLILDGVNSYTGPTNVMEGTLQFARQTAFYNNTPASWTDTNLVVSSGATAAFNVGGAGEFTATDLDIIKDLGTATGGFLDGSTLGVDTRNAAGTFTYGSVIADTDGGNNGIGFEKMGSGTLALTADNTYSGPTTISGGTLQLGDGGSTGSLGSDTGAVTNNGALVVNRNDTVTIANVITGTGAVGQAGSGTTVLTGASDYTGTTTVSNGELHVSGSLGATAVSG
ncbi:MAG: autotransporter-associated beta strand repeat-containing protein [Prosthecobacter sp.]